MRSPEGHGTQRALQDMDPQNTCFGCGPANAKGLHLHSYARGEDLVTPFQPRPEHTARGDVVNGGIQSTVLDCSGIWAGVLHLARQGLETIPFLVTASMEVWFRRPAPVDARYEAVGRVTRSEGRRHWADMELRIAGTGEAVTRATVVGHALDQAWAPNPLQSGGA